MLQRAAGNPRPVHGAAAALILSLLFVIRVIPTAQAWRTMPFDQPPHYGEERAPPKKLAETYIPPRHPIQPSSPVPAPHTPPPLKRIDVDWFPWGKFDPRVPLTCTNYPKMCSAPWSPGPDCCRNLCVDTQRDFFHCGRCGKMCRFGQVCCGGKCVDVLFDKNNCGWCGNKCEQGSTCTYGMCSYA